jgi:hypothetical protein
MNYLDIIIGTLITDMIVMVIYLFDIFKSKYYVEWYRKFGLGAVLADVTIIILFIIVAYYIYPHIFENFNLINFIILAVCIQSVHDLIFGYVITSIETKNNPILNIFNLYARDHGFYIIIVDALMVISSILIMTYLQQFSIDSKFCILVSSLYILTFLLYSI